MKNFLVLFVFALALASSANAFKVSAPANTEDKKGETKKEAVATDTSKKEAAPAASKTDSLGAAVTEMKANADAAVAAQAQKAVSATEGMTAKAADVKDTSKTPSILNNMATGLPQNPENSNKPKEKKK